MDLKITIPKNTFSGTIIRIPERDISEPDINSDVMDCTTDSPTGVKRLKHQIQQNGVVKEGWYYIKKNINKLY